MFDVETLDYVLFDREHGFVVESEGSFPDMEN